MIECQGNLCRLAGDIMIDTVPGLLKEIMPQIRSGMDTLDCSGICNVDSAALGFLLACKREAHLHNKNLNIVKLPASLLSLASLYGIVGQLAA
jgi:phospholipid transport system transporter-binding protein